MNILLTNDDGINEDGLIYLARSLRKEHNVYVLAPDINRSGVSQAVSFLTEILKFTEHSEKTYSCSGTPCDCVMLALLGIFPVEFDLIVSGINAGVNVGTDLIYSGTAAAARQAAIYNIPAIAFSLASGKNFFWEEAAAFALDNIEKLFKLWKKDTFINVNIPNIPDIKETALTFPSLRRYEDTLEIIKTQDGRQYCFVNLGDIITKAEKGSDEDAVSRNIVSISPVFIHPVVRRDQCHIAPSYAAVDPRPENL